MSAEEAGVLKPPFHFERFVDGKKMAEDVTIHHQPTLEAAFAKARDMYGNAKGMDLICVVERSAALPDGEPEKGILVGFDASDEVAAGKMHLTMEVELSRKWAVPSDVFLAPALFTRPACPKGWKLVPEEPANAMLIAALEATLAHFAAEGIDRNSPFDDYPKPQEQLRRCWAAMLAAAPSIPEGE